MGNKKFTISLGAGRVHKLRGIKDSTKTDASDVFVRTYLMSGADGPVWCRFRVFESSTNTRDKNTICIVYALYTYTHLRNNNDNNNILWPAIILHYNMRVLGAKNYCDCVVKKNNCLLLCSVRLYFLFLWFLRSTSNRLPRTQVATS